MDPVSCVSYVSWGYSVNVAETHETVHRESGMRYQSSSGSPDSCSNRVRMLRPDAVLNPYANPSPVRISLREASSQDSGRCHKMWETAGPRYQMWWFHDWLRLIVETTESHIHAGRRAQQATTRESRTPNPVATPVRSVRRSKPRIWLGYDIGAVVRFGSSPGSGGARPQRQHHAARLARCPRPARTGWALDAGSGSWDRSRGRGQPKPEGVYR